MQDASFNQRSSAGRYGRVSSRIRLDALRSKRALIIGAGSMGLPVTNQLVRHGVGTRSPGRIHIVDGALVDKRNLIGTDYRREHIGKSKAVAARSILTEINCAAAVSYWDRAVTEQDFPKLLNVARQADLVGLFADSFDVAIKLGDRCADVCPVVMAIFGPNADYAEVAISVPRQTPPVGRTLGRRQRTRINSPSAFGCDTTFVASFVAAVCLELLLDPADRGKLVPLRTDAPLMVVGLRKTWIFENQPHDVARTVVYVQVPQ